jgi:hypothetical protein
VAAESEQLRAARASGDLSKVVGVLKAEGIAELAAEPASAREQVGLEDAALRVSAGLTGKSGSERRAVLRDVQVGKTVTTQGVAKTTLTREEKIARTKSWAKTLTEEQRTSYLMSDRFDSLTDRQQELIAEVFGDLEERAFEDSIGIQNIDLDAETPTVDEIVGDDEPDDEVVDDNSDVEYEALFNEASWETE